MLYSSQGLVTNRWDKQVQIPSWRLEKISVMSISFRKIDIDQYDEEVLNDEDLYEVDSRDPDQILEEARQRQAAVRSALAKCV